MRRIKQKKGAAPLRQADENEKSKFVSYSPWKSSMKCVFTSMIILFALYYLYSLSVHTSNTFCIVFEISKRKQKQKVFFRMSPLLFKMVDIASKKQKFSFLFFFACGGLLALSCAIKCFETKTLIKHK